ncbi:MAG: hypothetical protein B7X37_04545 [Halothiobacillus sp. 14-55-98]|jgi:flagellar protein FlaG|nr:MAG: hypothetical protein B7X37_04545 [Halothiobacillus sp. 14-55-98]
MSALNNIVGSSIRSAIAGSDALSSSLPSSVPVGPAQSSTPQPAVPLDTSIGRMPTKDEVNQVLEDLMKRQQSSPTSVQFSVDDTLDQVVIKVVDPATQKVIKQIPSEAILKMRQDLLNYDQALANGSILSEKA